MDNLGYYNIASKNKIITEEKMKEFESDIKNGKKVDIICDDVSYKVLFTNRNLAKLFFDYISSQLRH